MPNVSAPQPSTFAHLLVCTLTFKTSHMCCTCLAGFEAAQGDGLALHVGSNSPYEHAAHPKGCRGLLSCCLQILQWKQGVVLLDHFWQPKLFRPPFTLQAHVELLVLLG